jgi:uncharacterized protein YpuA (DUF1002 family)
MSTPAIRDAVDNLRRAANQDVPTDTRTQIEQLVEALEDADEWEQTGERLREVERKLDGLSGEVGGTAGQHLAAARDAVRSHELYEGPAGDSGEET